MPFFMSSYFIAHGIETWDNHHLGSLCDWDRVAILQRGGADDTAPRIPQEFFFHHLSFGSSAHLALGKEMEQLDRLYRTMDSVALVWHDQEYVCLNISVERVAVQKMSTLCHLKIGYWLKVCFITDRFRC